MHPILEAAHKTRMAILEATGEEPKVIYLGYPEMSMLIQGITVHMSSSQYGAIFSHLKETGQLVKWGK
jgi:hypothetical protein